MIGRVACVSGRPCRTCSARSAAGASDRAAVFGPLWRVCWRCGGGVVDDHVAQHLGAAVRCGCVMLYASARDDTRA